MFALQHDEQPDRVTVKVDELNDRVGFTFFFYSLIEFCCRLRVMTSTTPHHSSNQSCSKLMDINSWETTLRRFSDGEMICNNLITCMSVH